MAKSRSSHLYLDEILLSMDHVEEALSARFDVETLESKAFHKSVDNFDLCYSIYRVHKPNNMMTMRQFASEALITVHSMEGIRPAYVSLKPANNTQYEPIPGTILIIAEWIAPKYGQSADQSAQISSSKEPIVSYDASIEEDEFAVPDLYGTTDESIDAPL